MQPPSSSEVLFAESPDVVDRPWVGTLPWLGASDLVLAPAILLPSLIVDSAVGLPFSLHRRFGLISSHGLTDSGTVQISSSASDTHAQTVPLSPL